MRTWVDASTLIALDAAGEVPVLRELLGEVAVTREVADEVFVGMESRALKEALGDWIHILEVQGDRRRWLSLGLGKGEASLFLTSMEDRLVLDEVPARTVAEAEGRDYIGLLGLLLAGVRRGKLPADRARDIVRRLVRRGFYMATDLYDLMMEELHPEE